MKCVFSILRTESYEAWNIFKHDRTKSFDKD